MKRNMIPASLLLLVLLPGIAAAHPAAKEERHAGVARYDGVHATRQHQPRERCHLRYRHQIVYPSRAGHHAPLNRSVHGVPPLLHIEIAL